MILYLVGAYLLFVALRVKPWLAALGALAFAFSSYNFIYVEAGHGNKAYAIALFAPIVAGVLLAFRKRYLLGAAIFAAALTIEIRFNHVQMTYYLMITLLILLGVELYSSLKGKELSSFLKSAGILAAASLLAVGANASLLWTTYEYSQDSIRGKANLKTESKEISGDGVTKEYAYQWSQGVRESLTFMIPNAYGGNSGAFDDESKVVQVLINRGVPVQQATVFAANLPSIGLSTYWGDKPFTSGPWYFGAIVVFLFVLGIFVVKGRLKYWILTAVILTLLLSFGRHFSLISDLFFDYFPLYNKFRAVESILVIPSLLIPVFAVLAIHNVLYVEQDVAKLKKKILYSLYIVGGLALLIAVLPDVFLSFRTSNHQEIVQHLGAQIGDNGLAAEIGNAAVHDRSAMARQDAFRSLLFILIAFTLMWLGAVGKLKTTTVVVLLALGITVDMWSVDKRYLNDNNFSEKQQIDKQFFVKREVDDLILMDKDPDYRVLDLTTNPFNDARPSLFHKSVGGYHAAKLMRYQELIEHQFTNAINEDVLDMLNTRYLITNTNENNQQIKRRPTACGNAWFVDQITFVKDNQQEMDALNSFNPAKEAFVHEDFKSIVNEKRLGNSQGASISLITYQPDHLVYEYTAPQDVFAVFSEVWYDKGWLAYVDGEEIPLARANYVLRGAQLPGGNHKVELVFKPASYYTGEHIALASSVILVLLLLGSIWMNFKKSWIKA